MVQKYPSMNSTFFVNEWNGKSILGHMLQTNQLNDQKIRMNDIIQNICYVCFHSGPCNEDEFRCPFDELSICLRNNSLCNSIPVCPGDFDEQDCGM